MQDVKTRRRGSPQKVATSRKVAGFFSAAIGVFFTVTVVGMVWEWIATGFQPTSGSILTILCLVGGHIYVWYMVVETISRLAYSPFEIRADLLIMGSIMVLSPLFVFAAVRLFGPARDVGEAIGWTITYGSLTLAGLVVIIVSLNLPSNQASQAPAKVAEYPLI